MAFIDYAGETEEERRRRLEQEAAAAAMSDEATASGGAAPGAFDSFFNNQLAAAQTRMAQQAEAANTEVETQTVKTYGDGSQEQIVKTQRPAPQAEVTGPAIPPPVMPQPAAPVPVAQAPAPVAPAVPGQESRPQVFPAFAQAVQQNQARPAAPAIPPEMADQAVAMPPMPQPGPPVQVASTDAAAGLQAAAAARAQQQAQQVAAQAPAVTPNLQQLAATAFAPTVERELQQPMTRADQDQMAVVAAHNQTDPGQKRNAFAQLIADPNVSEGNKALANKFMAEEYLHQRNIEKATKEIEEKTPTELSRYLKESKKEGSYIKAILLARLGLTDLAAKEQELINPTRTAETAVVGDKKYAVIKNKNGTVEAAFDTNGKRVGQETVSQIMAAAMPTKSFLLPQGAGGLMQKTITGPDGQPQVITGQVFTDPQTNTTYFQAGNKRYDTSGLSTPAQNVQNVYSAAGAKQQATQAAQTGQPQGALPPLTLEGGATPAAAATTTAATTADPAAARRAQSDIESLDKEIKRLKPSAPGYAKSLETFQTERAAAQQRLQAASGTGGVAQPAVSGTQRPGESFSAYQERLRRESATAQAASSANIDLSKEERSNFLSYEEKDIIPKADAGSNISRIRKQQLKGPDGILSNPEIVGMMSGSGTQAQEFANLVRDTVTGGITNDELSRRVNLLGVSDPLMKARIYNQLALNNTVAPETLKANAGAGSVSDAEQAANRRNNIDITRVPVYTAVTMLSRDQFEKDLNVARQSFRNTNPDFTTARTFNDAWGREKARLQGEYDRIYEARAKYIAKHSPDGRNPYAITEAYKQFPVPEFSRDGGWNYGTEFARKAARKPLDSFNK